MWSLLCVRHLSQSKRIDPPKSSLIPNLCLNYLEANPLLSWFYTTITALDRAYIRSKYSSSEKTTSPCGSSRLSPVFLIRMTGMTRWMSSSTFTLLTVGVTSLMPVRLIWPNLKCWTYFAVGAQRLSTTLPNKRCKIFNSP